MKKTIVNIISEQTIPNYLFIKANYELGDSLLFISSDKYKERIEWIVNTLAYRFPCEIERVVFPAGCEERWVDMQELLQKVLSAEKHYLVNLTGGTKYMSLLVQHVFEPFKSKFGYIPHPKNCFLVPNKNEALPLDYRITVDEYLSNYNVAYTHKEVVEEEAYTDCFFRRFVTGRLNFDVVNSLRAYRDKKQIKISEIETCEGTEKRPRIEGLSDFLKDIGFPMGSEGVLNKKEIEYLTGGWFEEYMYHIIKKHIHPQDIRLGVLIKKTENHNQNDLDVVFTSGNKLFVIECKTGIDGVRMFNETVYKATAIKEAVLGLSANTFIVSLATEDEQLKATAKNMGISYKCREDVDKPELLEKFIKEIKDKAQN